MRSVWTASHPLSELTLHHDWDLMVAASESLRLYLGGHGSVPSWNLLLCRGRPELATPYAWTLAWPSLFAYALPANWDLIALWVTMTVAGFLGTGALLTRFGASRLGALSGAALFCLNGYFASRFNVGHASFAFLHLVPLLMLCFESFRAATLAGRSTDRSLLSLGAVTWLLFTGGLPYAVFHLYPAFLLQVLFRTLPLRRMMGWSQVLRVGGLPLAAHAVGILLAGYKLVPVALWQLLHPRQGVVEESYSPGTVLANFTRFAPGSYDVDWIGGRSFASQFWPLWEYNAYVGVPALLLAGGALVLMLAARLRGARRWQTSPGVLALCVSTALLGMLLALGNGPPRPAALLRDLPLLSGVRAFPRYQILVLFAVSVLVSVAISRVRVRVLGGLLAAACCLPGIVQTGSLVHHIDYLTPGELARLNPLPPAAEVPRFAPGEPHPETHAQASRLFLLRHGYWVANCEEQVLLPWADLPASTGWLPLSEPPPARMSRLTGREIVLRYPAELATDVRLNIPLLDGYRTSIAPLDRRGPDAVFRAADLRGAELTISAHFPYDRPAWAASALGLVAAGIFWGARRRGG